MGKDLSCNFPYINQFYKECDSILNYSISDIMFNGPSNQLTLTQYAQPSIFIHSSALCNILKHEYNINFNREFDI